jgi:glycosyltransferase involved in cell wall biosynthesis
MSDPILTIAIPTYNRVDKLIRILQLIQDEIIKLNLSNDIEILVSDNSDAKFEGIHGIIKQPIKYIWNETNVGFDRNVLNCVAKSNTRYVWLFGDDDILEANILIDVIDGLKAQSPILSILKFGQFNISNSLENMSQVKMWHELSDSDEMSKLILESAKLTNYVIRKDLAVLNILDLERYIGTGWMHQILAIESLHNSSSPGIHYFNNVCASALKSESEALEWPPLAYRKGAEVLAHPFFSLRIGLQSQFIKNHSTNLIKSELLVLLYGLSGYWRVKDRNSYVEYLKSTTYSDYSGLGVRYMAMYILLRLGLYKVILPALNMWLAFKNFRLNDAIKKRQ